MKLGSWHAVCLGSSLHLPLPLLFISPFVSSPFDLRSTHQFPSYLPTLLLARRARLSRSGAGGMTSTYSTRLRHGRPAAGERPAAAAPRRCSRLQRQTVLRPQATSRAQAELLQEAPAARYSGSVPASGATANGLANGSRTNGGSGSSSSSAAGAAAAAVADAGLIITTFRWPAALGNHAYFLP